ncbi:MAG: glutamate--tRNA ligase family protein [Vicinamibacterales bacterium]
MDCLDVAALAARLPPSPRTRFAPSPTGYLHLGHVVNALYVWGLTAHLNGRVLLRFETHDQIRSRAEYVQAITEDLDWLGFHADEGPVDQTDDGRYAGALAGLAEAGHVYVCGCSRKDWVEPADGAATPSVYDGRCRDRGLADGPGRSLRFKVQPGTESFEDGRGVLHDQDPLRLNGDIILRDRDGQWSYHLAVTVDDRDQGIDFVIRGEDLLDATGVQLRLTRMLGRPRPPVFLHHALLMAEPGRKLSKSNRDTGVRDLRATGASPAEVIGLAAYRAGLTATAGPLRAQDAAAMVGSGPGPGTVRARTRVLG